MTAERKFRGIEFDCASGNNDQMRVKGAPYGSNQILRIEFQKRGLFWQSVHLTPGQVGELLTRLEEYVGTTDPSPPGWRDLP